MSLWLTSWRKSETAVFASLRNCFMVTSCSLTVSYTHLYLVSVEDLFLNHFRFMDSVNVYRREILIDGKQMCIRDRGKDSVDLIRDCLFSIQVKQPWLLVQYCNSDMESIGADLSLIHS